MFVLLALHLGSLGGGFMQHASGGLGHSLMRGVAYGFSYQIVAALFRAVGPIAAIFIGLVLLFLYMRSRRSIW